MAINYNEEKKIFSLHTKKSTYQMQVSEQGFLLHLYYGKKISGFADHMLTYYDRGFMGNPYDVKDNRTISLDALPQEFPMQGTGDYRTESLRIKHENGTYACDLRFKEYQIRTGKYGIEGLPAVYAGEEAQTLLVVLKDLYSKIEVTLLYGVLEEKEVITRSVIVTNGEDTPIYLEKIHSACLDFLQGSYDMLFLHGRHAMERITERKEITHGRLEIGSKRGTSSHQYNPFVMIATKEATEDFGDCYGMSFVYSGNFQLQAEKDQLNQTRVTMGIQDSMFSYELKSGERFLAPEVIMSYSANGMSELSHQFHKVIRENICRGIYQYAKRPVLINNWEATYFDFTGEKVIEIAKEAAKLGVEMLVLDDGWFGKRNSDTTGLGDWNVNETKLGSTLQEFVTKINETGLKFGIWIEPEMVSQDSRLYREHPDWAFAIPGRDPVRSRFQLVLDFSRKEVVDGIFEQLCQAFDGVNIEYIKWDMNRSIADVYSKHASNQNQGAILHRYMLGVYDLLERLLKRYPTMLLEGCSGGGGRFDAGMLYYSPQIWCSDNTDAIDRLTIQYGTSFGYPVSCVGAHVSAVPNHQTGRVTSMKTRGVVAMAGSFGYELDLSKLTEEEKETVKKQIQEYRKNQELIYNGKYYRLSDPFSEDDYVAWNMVAEDQTEAVVSVVTTKIHGNHLVSYLKIKGLHPEFLYCIEETGQMIRGDVLEEAGIPIPIREGEYQTWQLHLTKQR